MHEGPTHDARKQKTIGMWSSKSHTLEKLFSAARPCVRAHLPCPPLNSRASEQRTASQHKTPYTGLLDLRTTPLFFPACPSPKCIASNQLILPLDSRRLLSPC